MSYATPKLSRTNLPTEDLVMDDREDGKDPQYYCRDPKRMSRKRGPGGGYAFHLVSQGHRVGIFDSW
jgi:hypothetical protein